MRWNWGCFALSGRRFDVRSSGVMTRTVGASDLGMGLAVKMSVMGLIFVGYNNRCVSNFFLWEK